MCLIFYEKMIVVSEGMKDEMCMPTWKQGGRCDRGWWHCSVDSEARAHHNIRPGLIYMIRATLNIVEFFTCHTICYLGLYLGNCITMVDLLISNNMLRERAEHAALP